MVVRDLVTSLAIDLGPVSSIHRVGVGCELAVCCTEEMTQRRAFGRKARQGDRPGTVAGYAVLGIRPMDHVIWRLSAARHAEFLGYIRLGISVRSILPIRKNFLVARLAIGG